MDSSNNKRSTISKLPFTLPEEAIKKQSIYAASSACQETCEAVASNDKQSNQEKEKAETAFTTLYPQITDDHTYHVEIGFTKNFEEDCDESNVQNAQSDDNHQIQEEVSADNVNTFQQDFQVQGVSSKQTQGKVESNDSHSESEFLLKISHTSTEIVSNASQSSCSTPLYSTSTSNTIPEDSTSVKSTSIFLSQDTPSTSISVIKDFHPPSKVASHDSSCMSGTMSIVLSTSSSVSKSEDFPCALEIMTKVSPPTSTNGVKDSPPTSKIVSENSSPASKIESENSSPASNIGVKDSSPASQIVSEVSPPTSAVLSKDTLLNLSSKIVYKDSPPTSNDGVKDSPPIISKSVSKDSPSTSKIVSADYSPTSKVVSEESSSTSKIVSQQSPLSSEVISQDIPSTSTIELNNASSSDLVSKDTPSTSDIMSMDNLSSNLGLRDTPSSSDHMSIYSKSSNLVTKDKPSTSNLVTQETPSNLVTDVTPSTSDLVTKDTPSTPDFMTKDTSTSNLVTKYIPSTSNLITKDTPSTSSLVTNDNPSTSDHVPKDSQSTSKPLSKDTPSTSYLVSRDTLSSDYVSKDIPSTSDLVSKDIPSTSNPLSKDNPPTPDLVSKDNPSTSDLVSKDTQPTSDLVSKDNPSTSDLVSKDTQPTSALVSKDTPSTSDLVSEDTQSTSYPLAKDTPSTSDLTSKDTPSTSDLVSIDVPSASNHMSSDTSSTLHNESNITPSKSDLVSIDVPSASNHMSSDTSSTLHNESNITPSTSNLVSRETPSISNNVSKDISSSLSFLSKETPTSSSYVCKYAPSIPRLNSNDTPLASNQHSSGTSEKGSKGRRDDIIPEAVKVCGDESVQRHITNNQRKCKYLTRDFSQLVKKHLFNFMKAYDRDKYSEESEKGGGKAEEQNSQENIGDENQNARVLRKRKNNDDQYQFRIKHLLQDVAKVLLTTPPSEFSLPPEFICHSPSSMSPEKQKVKFSPKISKTDEHKLKGRTLSLRPPTRLLPKRNSKSLLKAKEIVNQRIVERKKTTALNDRTLITRSQSLRKESSKILLNSNSESSLKLSTNLDIEEGKSKMTCEKINRGKVRAPSIRQLAHLRKAQMQRRLKQQVTAKRNSVHLIKKSICQKTKSKEREYETASLTSNAAEQKNDEMTIRAQPKRRLALSNKPPEDDHVPNKKFRSLSVLKEKRTPQQTLALVENECQKRPNNSNTIPNLPDPCLGFFSGSNLVPENTPDVASSDGSESSFEINCHSSIGYPEIEIDVDIYSDGEESGDQKEKDLYRNVNRFDVHGEENGGEKGTDLYMNLNRFDVSDIQTDGQLACKLPIHQQKLPNPSSEPVSVFNYNPDVAMLYRCSKHHSCCRLNSLASEIKKNDSSTQWEDPNLLLDRVTTQYQRSVSKQKKRMFGKLLSPSIPASPDNVSHNLWCEGSPENIITNSYLYDNHPEANSNSFLPKRHLHTHRVPICESLIPTTSALPKVRVSGATRESLTSGFATRQLIAKAGSTNSSMGSLVPKFAPRRSTAVAGNTISTLGGSMVLDLYTGQSSAVSLSAISAIKGLLPPGFTSGQSMAGNTTSAASTTTTTTTQKPDHPLRYMMRGGCLVQVPYDQEGYISIKSGRSETHSSDSPPETEQPVVPIVLVKNVNNTNNNNGNAGPTNSFLNANSKMCRDKTVTSSQKDTQSNFPNPLFIQSQSAISRYPNHNRGAVPETKSQRTPSILNVSSRGISVSKGVIAQTAINCPTTTTTSKPLFPRPDPPRQVWTYQNVATASQVSQVSSQQRSVPILPQSGSKILYTLDNLSSSSGEANNSLSSSTSRFLIKNGLLWHKTNEVAKNGCLSWVPVERNKYMFAPSTSVEGCNLILHDPSRDSDVVVQLPIPFSSL